MILKEYIDVIVEKIISSNQKFSFEEFKNLETIEEMNWYASRRLPIIAKGMDLNAGSSRNVYQFGTGKVLKIAKNKYDVEQNIGEKVASRKFSSWLTPKVFDNDEEYKWITSEAIRTLKNKKEFKQLTGIDWDIFFKIFDTWLQAADIDSPIMQELLNEYPKEMNNPFIKKLFNAYEQGLDTSDMLQFIHWGINSSGELRYLDPGLSVYD